MNKDEALEQLEGKEFFERGKEIAQWADKQAQEPMAWMNDEGFGLYPTNDTAIPLYTHPHQWQGLTDDEIIDMYFQANISPQPAEDVINFIRAIEQSLKEKNKC